MNLTERMSVSFPGDCPADWAQFGAYCYRVNDQILTQPNAKLWCLEHGGGDLVKINSNEENEFVLQLVRRKAPLLKQVWIGMELKNGHYWSDLSIPVYTRWAPREPNGGDKEPCSQMYVGEHLQGLPYKASGSWNDIACDPPAEFISGAVCKRLP